MNRSRRSKKIMYSNSLNDLNDTYKDLKLFRTEQHPNQQNTTYNLQKNQFKQLDYHIEDWMNNRFDYQRMRTEFSKYNNGTTGKAQPHQSPAEPFDIEQSSIATLTNYCPTIPPANSQCQIQIESHFRSSQVDIDLEADSDELYYVSTSKFASKQIDVEVEVQSEEKGKLTSLILQQLKSQNKGKSRPTIKKQKTESDKAKIQWDIPDELCIKLDED